MRKTIIIILVSISFVLLLLLMGYGFLRIFFNIPAIQTHSWQTVYVDEVGSFRVPPEWNVGWDDDVLYFTDRPREEDGYVIHMVGTTRNTHRLFEGMERGELIRRAGILSNGASHSLSEYTISGKREELFSIHFDITEIVNPINFHLLVLNYDLSERLVTEITRTFRMESATLGR